MKRFVTKHTIQFGALLIMDSAVFGGVNPQQAPSYMLIVGFLLLSLTAYVMFRLLLGLLGLYGVPIRHRRRLLRMLTVFTAGVIALQSIGQLASRDIFVLSLLSVLLYLYVTYAKNLKQPDKQPP